MGELHSVAAAHRPTTADEAAVIAAPVLSADDVRTLNEARAILLRVESERRYEHPQTYRSGMLSQAADTAGDAVFDVLNIANVYFGVEVRS